MKETLVGMDYYQSGAQYLFNLNSRPDDVLLTNDSDRNEDKLHDDLFVHLKSCEKQGKMLRDQFYLTWQEKE